jgi:hypothetical protein
MINFEQQAAIKLKCDIILGREHPGISNRPLMGGFVLCKSVFCGMVTLWNQGF